MAQTQLRARAQRRVHRIRAFALIAAVVARWFGNSAADRGGRIVVRGWGVARCAVRPAAAEMALRVIQQHHRCIVVVLLLSVVGKRCFCLRNPSDRSFPLDLVFLVFLEHITEGRDDAGEVLAHFGVLVPTRAQKGKDFFRTGGG